MRSARCSFCGRHGSAAISVVAGPDGTGICGECALVAHQVAAEAMQPDVTDRLILGIGTLITNDRRKGGIVGPIEDAAVAIRMGRVTWVGSERDVPSRYLELPTVDVEGRAVVPGFVDAGSMLFGSASSHLAPESLIDRAVGVAGRMLQRGVTALDLRVGGGSDPLRETTLLAAARAVAERIPSLVSVTWVDGGGIDDRTLEKVMIPTAARLASAVLVDCPGDHSSAALLEKIGRLPPLRPRVRVCDVPDGCLDVAAGALSVEGWAHMEAVDAAVSVVEPAALLGGRPLPVRKLWDAGASVAFASGNDPDRRVIESPALWVSLACEVGGITPEEAVWCATRGGALALGDTQRGRLRPGDPGDCVVLDTDRVADIVRRPDANPAWLVVCDGAIVPK